MRLLIAPQEFKGTLSAGEAAEAIAAGIAAFDSSWICDLLPMADGGPGTLDVLLRARGGQRRWSPVHDPLLRPVDAEWAVLEGGAAVIECASASGLWRLAENERDPLRASSLGTGELIAEALDTGCRELLIGLGGSATNDGGAGVATALGYRLLDEQGQELPPGGAALPRLARIDATRRHQAIASADVRAAIDVTNPLCGPQGASAVYGPQKGATPAMVAELDAALAHFATVIARDLQVQVASLAGAGAAGGLGAGLVAFLGAHLVPGGELVATAAGFDTRMATCDAVITGEGRLDGQTIFGKGPAYVARRARAAGKPCVCITGIRGEGFADAASLFDVVEVAGRDDGPLPSTAEAREQISEAARRAAQQLARLT